MKQVYENDEEFTEITFIRPPVINISLHNRKNLVESLKNLFAKFKTTKKLKTRIKEDLQIEMLNRRNSKNIVIITTANNRINKKRDKMNDVLYNYLQGN